jgi:DNA-binding response OmpR family regulator
LAKGLVADEVLAKPFRAMDLLQEIDNLLGRRARGATILDIRDDELVTANTHGSRV